MELAVVNVAESQELKGDAGVFAKKVICGWIQKSLKKVSKNEKKNLCHQYHRLSVMS